MTLLFLLWLLLLVVVVVGVVPAAALGAEEKEEDVVTGQWTLLSPQRNDFEEYDHPAHRYNHDLVYDGARDRLVVFLGYYYDHKRRRPTWCADTWGYSLQEGRWRQLHDGKTGPAPTARYGHTVVLANGGNTAILFGGDTGTGGGGTAGGGGRRRQISKRNDVWAFDLRSHTWHELKPSSDHQPSPRSLHTSTLLVDPQDPLQEWMLVHGGLHETDTWLLNLSDLAWHQHTPTAVHNTPGARYGASLITLVPASNRGGSGSSGTGLGRRPSALHLGQALLFGGGELASRSLYNDVWLFTLHEGWTRLQQSVRSKTPNAPARLPGGRWVPSARNYHAAAVTRVKDRPAMVLVAGANCTGSCRLLDDVWLLMCDTWEWRPVALEAPNKLSSRYHHKVVVDAARGTLYTFGGESYRPTYMYHNSVGCLCLQGPTSLHGSRCACNTLPASQLPASATVSTSASTIANTPILLVILFLFLLLVLLLSSSTSRSQTHKRK